MEYYKIEQEKKYRNVLWPVAGNVADLGRRKADAGTWKSRKAGEGNHLPAFLSGKRFIRCVPESQREWGISGKNISMAEDIAHVYLDM